MKGLYLNVPGAEERIREIDATLGVPTHITNVRHGTDRILVSHHPLDWPAGPTYIDDRSDRVAAASGWFLFRGRLGDLQGLAESFWEARDADARLLLLREIEAGAYVILFLSRAERALITDPFGLHPHYYAGESPFAALAPSPVFIRGDATPDPLRQSILRCQDHLFGNLTAYPRILRLDPNALITPNATWHAFDFHPTTEPGPSPHQALRSSIAALGDRPRILPISGGLDSRLLLASSSFDYGYTFGPRDTGDRPIARRFADRFRDYHEFSLLDLTYPDELYDVGHRLLEGVCHRPFSELLPVYRMLHQRWGEGCFFFDGYAGDVLQRGTFLTHGGVRGSLAKLFPILTRFSFDPIALLLRRYPGLEPAARDLLVETYRDATASWDIADARKVVLFELLYGRAARHALNGGTILSGQFFTAIQPFYMPRVFRSFWRIDPMQAMTYRALRPIWRDVPPELADVPTYSGFKPNWNPDRARATMLWVKGLGRVSLIRRSISYERERSRIRQGKPR
jgi:hypothetical protein